VGDPDSKIRVLNVDEERPESRAISKIGIPSHPSMSPDLKWVIADHRDAESDMLEMHLVGVATGENEIIFRIRRPEIYPDGTRNATHAHPVWHPDGNAVVFNAEPGEGGQVFLMMV
jgi:Tol biopolymer transport system component